MALDHSRISMYLCPQCVHNSFIIHCFPFSNAALPEPAAKVLHGSRDAEALAGPLVRGLLSKVVHPLKNVFSLWDALQFAAGAMRFHPPFFLPMEEV